ncbi:hypothetical protein LX90_007518 [Lentzea flava]|nr:hypothetical protein [Lentzea flava]
MPDGAVVWLDDLELYLAADGLDLALLQQLCPAGRLSRTVVVATMRDEELARHTIASTEFDRVDARIDRAAIDLIAQVQGRRRIPVAAALSASERERAQQVGERDGRVRRAVQAPEGFAEYLAAGTAMMGRWSIGDGPLFMVGQALISAAVDCRRAGYHKPVSITLLGELHRHYMAPTWRHRDDLPTIAEALRWTHQPVLGASSCLQPRSQSTALASDYLLDRSRSGQSPLPERVNDILWLRLLDSSAAVDAISIGNAAYHADLVDIAQAAWEKASTANVRALVNLGILMKEKGCEDEAEKLYHAAADAGDTIAMGLVGMLLMERGRDDESLDYLRRAVEAGETKATGLLGMMLAKQRRDDEALGYLRRAADAGETNVLGTLGITLERQGHYDEAAEFYRRAVDAGDTKVLNFMSKMLVRQGREDEAIEYLRRAVDAGETENVGALGGLLAKRGREEEAMDYFRSAADAGDVNAMAALGGLLAKRGREEEAMGYLRSAADAGHMKAAQILAMLQSLLQEAGEALVPIDDVAAEKPDESRTD